MSSEFQLRRLEWYRVSHKHKVLSVSHPAGLTSLLSLFFLMSGDGRSRLYSHDWLERSQAAHYTHTEDGIRTIKLVLHQVGRELTGQLECQVIMEVRRKESVLLVPAVRSHNLLVVERPEDGGEEVVRVVEEEEGLKCEAEGYPAPYLSWVSLTGDTASPVSEDKVETLDLVMEEDSGLEVSRERMYLVEEGEFACLVRHRHGDQKEVRSEESAPLQQSVSV